MGKETHVAGRAVVALGVGVQADLLALGTAAVTEGRGGGALRDTVVWEVVVVDGAGRDWALGDALGGWTSGMRHVGHEWGMWGMHGGALNEPCGRWDGRHSMGIFARPKLLRTLPSAAAHITHLVGGRGTTHATSQCRGSHILTRRSGSDSSESDSSNAHCSEYSR